MHVCNVIFIFYQIAISNLAILCIKKTFILLTINHIFGYTYVTFYLVPCITLNDTLGLRWQRKHFYVCYYCVIKMSASL